MKGIQKEELKLVLVETNAQARVSVVGTKKFGRQVKAN